MYDFLIESTRTLKQAGELGGIDPAVIDLLAAPMHMVELRIPLRMDDGSRRIFDAYRVRHNGALGPTRDGTRISAGLDADECRALGMIMSIKHAAGNIPAGGGKGGIVAEPRELSEWEYERLCRAYVRHLRPGSGHDVPGADIGTNPQTMAWMLDELEQIRGEHTPASINDKPPILGGSVGGYEATGRGVFDATVEAAVVVGLNLEGARVAIHGFGQVGAVAARLYQEAGAKVIAVSDRRGGIHREAGLDVAAVVEHRSETGSVRGFPGADDLDHLAVLELDCEILVPAAVQGVITTENVDRIRTRLIVEAANGPIGVDADEALVAKGITVVPDVIANSGSVHVCQMERTQGLSDERWTLERVDQLRRERLVGAYREALHTANELELPSARLGAWVNALQRLESAITMRGWM